MKNKSSDLTSQKKEAIKEITWEELKERMIRLEERLNKLDTKESSKK